MPIYLSALHTQINKMMEFQISCVFENTTFLTIKVLYIIIYTKKYPITVGSYNSLVAHNDGITDFACSRKRKTFRLPPST